MKLTVEQQLKANKIKKAALRCFIAGIGAVLFACNPSPKQANSYADDQQSSTSQYCFLRVEGTAQQDSSFVQVDIDKHTVNGNFNWVPAEKDSRKGSLTGTKIGDTLQVTWHFSQEGMQDSIALTFLLKDQVLRQRPIITAASGKEITDVHADFSIEYQRTNCQ